MLDELARLKRTYKIDNDAPPTIIAKFSAPVAAAREMAGGMLLYEMEYRFYEELVDEIPIQTPTCYYQSYSRETHEFVILMSEAKGEVSDQVVHIEQLLINLVKNALEASAKTQGIVEIQALDSGAQCEIQIKDQGLGISNPSNLFVPFYTTKAKGTGIRLVLCRQIADSHHGSVTLINRKDGAGAVATAYLSN
ncbi:MAG: ATP-binding protein [Pseudomonadales bacterium]